MGEMAHPVKRAKDSGGVLPLAIGNEEKRESVQPSVNAAGANGHGRISLKTEAIENEETSAHFKFSDFDSYAEAVYAIYDDGLLNEALQLRMQWDGLESMSYYPMNDDALCTIDIYW